MIEPSARGASMALAAQLWAAVTPDQVAVALTWDVDFTKQSISDEEWGGYLDRLKTVLEATSEWADMPIRIRTTFWQDGQRVQALLRLPLPDVSANLPLLCGGEPPVGFWRLELVGSGEPQEHRKYQGPITDRFAADIPF